MCRSFSGFLLGYVCEHAMHVFSLFPICHNVSQAFPCVFCVLLFPPFHSMYLLLYYCFLIVLPLFDAEQMYSGFAGLFNNSSCLPWRETVIKVRTEINVVDNRSVKQMTDTEIAVVVKVTAGTSSVPPKLNE